MAATRRLRAPSSQEVFFVAQASRGRVGLGAEVVTMVQYAPRRAILVASEASVLPESLAKDLSQKNPSKHDA